ALRAEAAEREAATTVDTTNTPDDGPRVLEVGETFHAIHDGLTLPCTTQLWGGRPAIITKRSSTYTLDTEMVEASRDKFGNLTWTTRVYDEQAQVQKWGRVYLRPGAAPEGMESFVGRGREWSEQRELAVMKAQAISDPYERGLAMAAVTKRFGTPPNPNASTTRYTGDSGDEAVRR
ncbi:hypothetical protein, partial [Microbacterium sp. Bi128]|uniref:hypothetical protein n=1 Tax=Microbacterium sp. Bi128 TaxID=2821115 RepID=UPI001E3B07F4